MKKIDYSKLSTKRINDEVMPTVNEIKAKMEMLRDKYNIKLDEFAFPEIKLEEIIDFPEK